MLFKEVILLNTNTPELTYITGDVHLPEALENFEMLLLI